MEFMLFSVATSDRQRANAQPAGAPQRSGVNCTEDAPAEAGAESKQNARLPELGKGVTQRQAG